MRRSHAQLIAGSILILAASVMWVGVGLLANHPDTIVLHVPPALILLIVGSLLMRRGNIPDE